MRTIGKSIVSIAAITLLLALTGCSYRTGVTPASKPPSSALADDAWYRPSDQSVFSPFDGGQQSAPLEEGFYFDQTASGSQSAYVLGAADDMGARILSFAASAPPHSRIEVYGTSDSPGQPGRFSNTRASS
jgi:hypothetical protein